MAAAATLVFWVGGDAVDVKWFARCAAVHGQQIVRRRPRCRNFDENGDQPVVGHRNGPRSPKGMALGEGLGLSRKMLFDSLLGMPAVAPFLAAKRDKIDKGNYEAEFPLRWMQKDMQLASVSAYESGVAMPLTNAAKELYLLAMREGHAGQDFSATSTIPH